MDKIFSGYLPQPITVNDIKKALVSFDTNALLNIYRYKESTAKQYLTALAAIKEQVWLPYMVGLEFHTLRAEVLKQEKKFIEKIYSKIEKFKEETQKEISSKEHSSFPQELFTKKLNEYMEELLSIIDQSKNDFPDLIRKDHIREKIVKIFRGKVSEPLNEQLLQNIYNEGELRFKNKIPPGYKDEQNKVDCYKLYGDLVIQTKYSDFIIWYEIRKKAHDSKKNIIFVTDEKKEDWIWEVNGFQLGARPELVTEIQNKYGTKFSIISSSQFISLMSEMNNVKISKSSIEDVELSSLSSWKSIVVQAFIALGGKANLNEMYKWIELNTQRQLTENWQATARKTIYYYCKDRDLFLGKEEIFKALDRSTYQLLI